MKKLYNLKTLKYVIKKDDLYVNKSPEEKEPIRYKMVMMALEKGFEGLGK